MLQVVDVICKQPGQGDFAPATDLAGCTLPFLRHTLGDVKKVGVVCPPEVNQVAPSSSLVVLDADPRLLVITWEILSTSNLTPHEALMIVRGRVNQVADDLLL